MLSRFSLLLLGFTAGLYASSFTSVSCTFGSITQTQSSSTRSSCSIEQVVPSGTIGVDAEASVQGFPDSAGISLIADAAVLLGTPQPASSHATATYDQWFQTNGPKRSGEIDFYTFAFGFSSFAVITDGVHTYNEAPFPPATLPFELGIPFHVSIVADAIGACSAGTCTQSSITFGINRLFEADGTTPVDFFAVPEPADLMMLLMGGSLLSVAGFRRRRPKRL